MLPSRICTGVLASLPQHEGLQYRFESRKLAAAGTKLDGAQIRTDRGYSGPKTGLNER